VTFDAADPHGQAAFWAQVMGHEVEDHSSLVNKLVEDGLMPASGRIAVDGRAAFRTVAACSDPTGTEPRLYFQQVPEPKMTKNRVHLDIHVDPDRQAAEVARLVDLGAEMVAVHDDQGPTTYVLRDPEGNEFCVH
jgi:hypothetical protein